mmetsp:Transcript_72927/g.207784  ORF Transcript_72927/g.207784 Transcript_72927/m.207784 type:complete len:217 (-) Transcript_72927:531-1181(-)
MSRIASTSRSTLVIRSCAAASSFADSACGLSDRADSRRSIFRRSSCDLSSNDSRKLAVSFSLSFSAFTVFDSSIFDSRFLSWAISSLFTASMWRSLPRSSPSLSLSFSRARSRSSSRSRSRSRAVVASRSFSRSRSRSLSRSASDRSLALSCSWMRLSCSIAATFSLRAAISPSCSLSRVFWACRANSSLRACSSASSLATFSSISGSAGGGAGSL